MAVCLAHYRFENNRNDELGNYNASGDNTFATFACVVDGSYCGNFDGAGKNMLIPQINLGTKFTISCWMYYYGSGNSNRTILTNIHDSNGFRLKFNGDYNRLELYTTDGTNTAWALSSTGTSPGGTKTHLVAAVDLDAGTVQFYIQNSDKGAESSVVTGINTNQEANYGLKFDENSSMYGYSDELQIYSGILSAAQVSYLYNNPGSRVVNEDMVVSVNGQTSLSAAISALLDFQATATGQTTSYLSIEALGTFSGNSSGQTLLSSFLEALWGSYGTITGSSQSQAYLEAFAQIVSSVVGQASVLGYLKDLDTMLGYAYGQADVSGQISTLFNLSGDVSAFSAMTSALQAIAGVSGDASSFSVTAGEMGGLLAMVASSEGRAEALSYLEAFADVMVAIAGDSAVTGIIYDAGKRFLELLEGKSEITKDLAAGSTIELSVTGASDITLDMEETSKIYKALTGESDITKLIQKMSEI